MLIHKPIEECDTFILESRSIQYTNSRMKISSMYKIGEIKDSDNNGNIQ